MALIFLYSSPLMVLNRVREVGNSPRVPTDTISAFQDFMAVEDVSVRTAEVREVGDVSGKGPRQPALRVGGYTKNVLTGRNPSTKYYRGE